VLLLVLAAVLLAAGATLGGLAAIAIRRSEGVFLPAGYVALICLAGGGALARYAIRL
jgi:hypothetical protein